MRILKIQWECLQRKSLFLFLMDLDAARVLLAPVARRREPHERPPPRFLLPPPAQSSVFHPRISCHASQRTATGFRVVRANFFPLPK